MQHDSSILRKYKLSQESMQTAWKASQQKQSNQQTEWAAAYLLHAHVVACSLPSTQFMPVCHY